MPNEPSAMRFSQIKLYTLKQILCRSATLLSLFLSTAIWAGSFDDCNKHFYATTEPDYIDTKLLNGSVPLCFEGFATLYSELSRTPIWSTEHLTRERLSLADELPREDSFHSESRLPQRMRAQLSDYKGSGYDRGHLAPNADMANPKQQYESFSLANIIPHAPDNNRYVWRNVESLTRYLTKKYGDVYVLTGVSFKGSQLEQLNGRVLVPSHLFKAIYIPQLNEAGAYYAPNDNTKRIEVISLDELALRTGIDAFPAIASEVKSTTMPLPIDMAEANEQADRRAQNDEVTLVKQVVIEILRWIVDLLSTK